MKSEEQKKKPDLLSFFSFVIPLTIFLLTSPQYPVSFGDSTELIFSAFKFQSAHPPGYPLFVLIGKIFTLLPIGTIAFRLSIASSLMSALTVLFIYKILKIFFTPEGSDKKISSFGAFFASQFIAFSYSLWLYSIIPEVFALNNLIAVAIIYLTLKIGLSADTLPQNSPILLFLKRFTHNKASTDDKNSFLNILPLCLIFFLFGLGLSNHMTIVLLFPPVAFYLFINGYLRSLKTLKYLSFAFLLGLSPYLLVLIFSYLPHFPAFGNIPGFSRLISYITRSDYGGLLSGGVKGSLAIGDGEFDMVGLYFKTLFSGYFYLPFIGAIYLMLKKISNYRSEHALIIYTVISSGVIFPIFSLYNLGGSDLHSRGVSERFGLLGFIFWGIALSIGIDLIFKTIKTTQLNLTKPLKEIIHLFSPLLFLILTAILILTNYSRVNKRDYMLSYNYGINILNQVEDNAVIFTNDDLINSTLIYLTQIEKIKPQIKIVGLGFLGNTSYQKELKSYWPDLYDIESTYAYDIARDIIKKNSANGVYFSAIDDPYPYGFLGNPYYLEPRGLVIKADEKTSREDVIAGSNINYWEKYNYQDFNKIYNDAFSKLAIFNYYFSAKINNQIYFNLDCIKCAEKQIAFASTHIGNDEKLKDDLSKFKKETVGNSDPALLLTLAKDRFLHAEKLTHADFHRTAWDLTRAEMQIPNNFEIEGGLGEIYEMLEIYDLAYQKYQIAARLDPFGGWEGSMERVKKKL